MRSFLAYLRKEIIEGIRNYKYIIIAVTFILMAILDPLILKMLPKLLQGQVPGDISQLIQVDQRFALNNYIKDIFQMINIVVILTLMGIISDELKEKTLVFPFSKGVSITGMVFGKTIAYILALPIFIFVGFLSNYYYINILFSEGTIELLLVIKIAVLISIYFMFVNSLVLLLSSLTKKGLYAGLGSLVIVFVMPLLCKINQIKTFIPHYLVETVQSSVATGSTIKFDTSMLTAIGFIVVYIVIFNILAVYRINRIDIVR